jgi:hypothetical protein
MLKELIRIFSYKLFFLFIKNSKIKRKILINPYITLVIYPIICYNIIYYYNYVKKVRGC